MRYGSVFSSHQSDIILPTVRFDVARTADGSAGLGAGATSTPGSQVAVGRKRSGCGRPNEWEEFPMGFRRRTRRRALVAGAVAGGAIAHHERKKYAEEQAASDQGPADDYQEQEPAQEQQPQYAPPPPDSADQIEHLAQLHASGALTDEEFTAAKAKLLGS
jgi:hypothetical protein